MKRIFLSAFVGIFIFMSCGPGTPPDENSIYKINSKTGIVKKINLGDYKYEVGINYGVSDYTNEITKDSLGDIFYVNESGDKCYYHGSYKITELNHENDGYQKKTN